MSVTNPFNAGKIHVIALKWHSNVYMELANSSILTMSAEKDRGGCEVLVASLIYQRCILIKLLIVDCYVTPTY